MGRRKARPRHLRVWIEADSAVKAECVARNLQAAFEKGGFEVRGPVPLPKRKGDLAAPVKVVYDAPDLIWSSLVLHTRMLLVRNANAEALSLAQGCQLPNSINIRFGY